MNGDVAQRASSQLYYEHRFKQLEDRIAALEARRSEQQSVTLNIDMPCQSCGAVRDQSGIMRHADGCSVLSVNQSGQ